MTSVIHFKFRSALLSETLNFDGDYLSLLDLKRLIAKKKGLLNAADIDFSITNKQTGEEYTKEDQFIPKNTEVLVKKINAKPQLEALRTNPSGSAAVRPTTVSLGMAPASESPSLPFSSSAVTASDGAAEDLDEDALLKKMIEEQNVEWQRTQQQRRATSFAPNNQKFAPGSGAKPPSHYICNRCEKPGHWKKDCPTMGDPAFDERKFAVGVPICRTRVLADQSGAGAGLDVMRLPDGRLVQCVPAEADFEKAIGTGKQMVNVPADGSIPKELQCAITKDVAENAHILPCCQSNVSLSAVTPILEDRATCPICLQPDITLDMLKPNLRLRETVRTFLKAALDRGIRLKRPVRQETESDKGSVEKGSEVQETQVLPPPAVETGIAQEIKVADDGRMSSARQQGIARQGESPDMPFAPSAGGSAAPFQQNGGRDGQGRSKRSGAKRRRRKAQGGQGGQGGMGGAGMGGAGAGAPYTGHGGTAPFYGGALPYNAQGMMLNRSGQNGQFPAGYGGMRNIAPPMHMYMNPMGMQRMMPPWPGRAMMMPVSTGNGQNWDDGRESSYESSRSSRFSGSRSRSRGRSWSRDRSRSRSRDRDRKRAGGKNRESRRDDRERRDRSRSRDREKDKDRGRDRTLKRKDSRVEDDDNANAYSHKDAGNGESAQIVNEDDPREVSDRKSREKGDEKGRKDRDRSRDNSRDRGRGRDRDRSRDDRDGDRYRDQRDKDRGREDRGRDRSRDDYDQRRSRGNKYRDGGASYDDRLRRGSDTKDGSKGKDSSDRPRQESERDKGLTPEEENRIRRFGTKDLVLFSKSEASKNMASDVLELRSKTAERRSAESLEPKSQQNASAEEKVDIDVNTRDREEGHDGSESVSSERKRRDRVDNDSSIEAASDELPGLYMDATQRRKSRDPIQPYRPPIALLSKKAAAGQERSRISSQVSVLDRLGTAPASESDGSGLRRSKSSGSSGSKRMRGGSGDVTVTVRL